MKSHIAAAILLTSVCISLAPSDPNPRLSQPSEKCTMGPWCAYTWREKLQRRKLFACIFLCHKCTCSMNNSNNNACLQTFAVYRAGLHPSQFINIFLLTRTLPLVKPFFPPEKAVWLARPCWLNHSAASTSYFLATHKWLQCHLLFPGACVRTSSFPRLQKCRIFRASIPLGSLFLSEMNKQVHSY